MDRAGTETKSPQFNFIICNVCALKTIFPVWFQTLIFQNNIVLLSAYQIINESLHLDYIMLATIPRSREECPI